MKKKIETILDELKKQGGKMDRAAVLTPVITNETRADGEAPEYRFELSFSSEEPYERWFGMEILGHKKGEVRLDWLKGGSAPLLNQHDADQLIGVIESVNLESGRATAVVRFGKGALAQEIRQDVIDRIRSNVSVGYRVHEMKLIKKEDGKPDTYRVTDWEPIEISLVSMPADRTVGVGRGDSEPTPTLILTENEKMKTLKERAVAMGLHEDASEEAVRSAELAAATAAGERKAEAGFKAEQTRQSEIRAMGKAHGMIEEAEAAITASRSAKDFTTEVLAKYSVAAPQRARGSDEKKLLEGFSLRKFLLGAVDGARLSGAEAEVQQEGQREANARGMDVGGGYIPAMAIGEIARRAAMLTRAGQNATTNADGKFIVATENMGLISALNPRLWMAQLGVTQLSGLVNNLTLPAVDDEGEAVDRTEVELDTAVDVVFAQRTLSPTRIPAACVFSSQLLRQSSPQIDSVLSNIVLSRIARRWNAKGIEFLLALVGTNEVTTNGAVLSRSIMRQFLTKIQKENADESMGSFLINPDVEGILAETKVDAGSGLFIHTEKENGEGRILNRRSLTTSLVPADLGDDEDLSAIIHGSFPRLWMGDWGGVDLIRDNVTKAATGQLVVTAASFIGFAAESPKYFAIAKDVDPAAVVVE